jgi:hypothetical protein
LILSILYTAFIVGTQSIKSKESMFVRDSLYSIAGTTPTRLYSLLLGTATAYAVTVTSSPKNFFDTAKNA